MVHNTAAPLQLSGERLRHTCAACATGFLRRITTNPLHNRGGGRRGNVTPRTPQLPTPKVSGPTHRWPGHGCDYAAILDQLRRTLPKHTCAYTLLRTQQSRQANKTHAQKQRRNSFAVAPAAKGHKPCHTATCYVRLARCPITQTAKPPRRDTSQFGQTPND